MLTLDELYKRLAQCQAEMKEMTKRRNKLRVRRHRYKNAIAALEDMQRDINSFDSSD